MESISESFWFQLTASVVVILGIVIAVLMIVQHFKRTPPIEAEFATHDDLERVRQELLREVREDRSQNKAAFLRLENNLHESTSQIMVAGHSREQGIYDRVNDISASLQAQIRSLPNEIIVILKNTGALK